ncbi:MAG: hypothetical protein HGN29_15860 [Asgard group archaeon]|nr:hypothetical protein [Asgard group archaeon]
MVNFNPNKLSVKYLHSENLDILSRKYTLTHSDFTGELFLSIGNDYDYKKLNKLYVRFMRDEVLAEWKGKNDKYELHIYTHISGGCILGGAKFRNNIIRSHLPLVFKILKYAERDLIDSNKFLNDASIIVHFKSKRKKYDKIENMGKLSEI